MKELAQNIQETSARLTSTVVEEMYRNPFWDERFGARGRKFALEDGRHHLSYLVESLLAQDAALLTGYARWLQSVLTTRGMCTRHLAENYQRLAAAIAKESFPRGEVALEYLALAEAALEYAGGPPQELQRASGRLARRSAALIYERHPEWEQKWGPSGREKCVDDGLYHLSFLADALALGRPESFASYCAWMADFLERRGMSRGHLEEMIAAISDGLGADEAVSGELKTSATKALQGGRDAIIGADLPRA